MLLYLYTLCLLISATYAQSQGCQVDLTIVLDISGSIIHNPTEGGPQLTENFQKVKRFVKDIVNSPQIQISAQETHVSLVLFESNPVLKVKLSSFSRQEVIDTLDATKAWGGSNPDRALQMVREKVYTETATGPNNSPPGNRSDATDVVLFIGDGYLEDSSNGLNKRTAFIDQANYLKRANVKIISVGVGYLLNEGLLRSISSESTYYFGDKNPNNLASFVPGVAALACNKAPPSKELQPPTEPPVIPPVGGIGVYYAFAGDKQKTTKEYLMGNKSLGIIPVGMSMFMSYISAISVLGNPAEM